MVIDPDECIDCTLCVAECPVNAIFPEDEVPAEWQHYIALNQELSQSSNWKTITAKKNAPDDAAQWDDVTDKFHLLDRNGA